MVLDACADALSESLRADRDRLQVRGAQRMHESAINGIMMPWKGLFASGAIAKKKVAVLVSALKVLGKGELDHEDHYRTPPHTPRRPPPRPLGAQLRASCRRAAVPCLSAACTPPRSPCSLRLACGGAWGACLHEAGQPWAAAAALRRGWRPTSCRPPCPCSRPPLGRAASPSRARPSPPSPPPLHTHPRHVALATRAQALLPSAAASPRPRRAAVPT